MSNQEEDEVEEELLRMEKEARAINLPQAPNSTIEEPSEELPDAPQTVLEDGRQRQKERAKERREALHA